MYSGSQPDALSKVNKQLVGLEELENNDMNKEEYIKDFTEINSLIKDLHKQVRNLNN